MKEPKRTLKTLKEIMKIRLVLALAGLAISFAAVATMAQDAMKVVAADELVWK